MYFDQLDGSSDKGACHQVWWRDGYLGLTTSFPLTTLRSPPPHIINKCNFKRGILIQSLEPKTQSHTSLRAVYLLSKLTSIPSSLACPSSLTWMFVAEFTALLLEPMSGWCFLWYFPFPRHLPQKSPSTCSLCQRKSTSWQPTLPSTLSHSEYDFKLKALGQAEENGPIRD